MFAIKFKDGMYYAGGSLVVEDNEGKPERVPCIQVEHLAKRFSHYEVAQQIADTINEYTRKEYPLAEVVEV